MQGRDGESRPKLSFWMVMRHSGELWTRLWLHSPSLEMRLSECNTLATIRKGWLSCQQRQPMAPYWPPWWSKKERLPDVWGAWTFSLRTKSLFTTHRKVGWTQSWCWFGWTRWWNRTQRGDPLLSFSMSLRLTWLQKCLVSLSLPILHRSSSLEA